MAIVIIRLTTMPRHTLRRHDFLWVTLTAETTLLTRSAATPLMGVILFFPFNFLVPRLSHYPSLCVVLCCVCVCVPLCFPSSSGPHPFPFCVEWMDRPAQGGLQRACWGCPLPGGGQGGPARQGQGIRPSAHCPLTRAAQRLPARTPHSSIYTPERSNATCGILCLVPVSFTFLSFRCSLLSFVCVFFLFVSLLLFGPIPSVCALLIIFWTKKEWFMVGESWSVFSLCRQTCRRRCSETS